MNCFPKSQNFWIWRTEWNVHGIVAPRPRREFVRPDRNEPGNGRVSALPGNQHLHCRSNFRSCDRNYPCRIAPGTDSGRCNSHRPP